MKNKIVLLGAATLLMSAWAQADSHDDEATGPGAEATMRLMNLPEVGLPEAVTKDIELPAAADDSEAAEHAVNGLETAAENMLRRDAGIQTAQDALESALDNQESRGRSSENNPNPDSRPDPGPPTG